MPTIRQYSYKSIKIFFFVLAVVVAVSLLCFVADWMLPTKSHNWFVLFSLSLLPKATAAVAVMLCLFFAYRACKVIQTEKSPRHEFVKMAPATLVWLFIILFAVKVFADPAGEIDCKKFNYSGKLNGGVKEIGGQKYTISICGSGINNSRLFGDSLDNVQLTVFNKQGTILARRYYKIFWDGLPGHEPITLRKDGISYQDDEKQKDFSINIPPTLIDRALSLFPGFSPNTQ